MIDRLHEATREAHADATDTDFELLFHEHTSHGDYLAYLTRQYGFEAPLEAALEMTPHLDLMIDLRARQKANLLAHDLLGLGIRPSELSLVPLCLRVPQFRGAAEALGWMYVIERATLTHCMIRRHLLTRLPKTMRDASGYLQAYAGLIGTRWRGFGNVLDEVARQPAIADRIVSAANDAFRTQRRWIQNTITQSSPAAAVAS